MVVPLWLENIEILRELLNKSRLKEEVSFLGATIFGHTNGAAFFSVFSCTCHVSAHVATKAAFSETALLMFSKLQLYTKYTFTVEM